MLFAPIVLLSLATSQPLESAAASPRLVVHDELGPLVDAARGNRAVVLGEVHGKKEPALLLVELFERLYREAGYRYLALESQEDWQPWVDQYMAGHDEERALRVFPSAEMRRLLVLMKRLAREHPTAPPRLLLVDGPSSWNVDRLEQTRDQRMFAHLRKVYDVDPAAKILLYVGNTHTVEGIQLETEAEGEGHRFGAHRIKTYPVAHLLDLWLEGKSLSVRTVDEGDPVGRALLPLLARKKAARLVIPIDDSPLARQKGALEPGGSYNVALRDEELQVVTDWIVAFRRFSERSKAK